MEREVLNAGNLAPAAKVTGKGAIEGAKLVGIYKGFKKESRSKRGNLSYIHSFELIDIENAGPYSWDGTEQHEEDVDKGDEVVVFANAPLHRSLLQAEVGDKLEIVYDGLSPMKNGKDFHKTTVTRLK